MKPYSIAVITGDIVNSRSRASNKWQPLLKKVLKQYGKEPMDWEIFRGDSFQLAIPQTKALTAAIHIKAAIKQVAGLDVRMGIGIGMRDFKGKKVTVSTGNAFIRSGESFDNLKRQILSISMANEEIDNTLNIMLALALLTMNNWTETVASVITTAIQNPTKAQLDIAAKMNKSQSSISEALKRGGFEEIKQLEVFYLKQISNL